MRRRYVCPNCTASVKDTGGGLEPCTNCGVVFNKKYVDEDVRDVYGAAYGVQKYSTVEHLYGYVYGKKYSVR